MTGTTVSILIPARNEELTLPSTLPGILRAAERLDEPFELLVVTPTTSPMLHRPPIRDRRIRWLATERPGKFQALRVGAAHAGGDVLVLVDADVRPEPAAFTELTRTIRAGTADVAAGRITFGAAAGPPVARLLTHWASMSADAWNLLRSERPEHRWALPGALYALRSELLPESLDVALVDDASIGLAAERAGARFAYAANARVEVSAPRTYPEWCRQKLRSRRGWAALAEREPAKVRALEACIARYFAASTAGCRTARLMWAQDRILRGVARLTPRPEACASGSWTPQRATAPRQLAMATHPPTRTPAE
ncbi:glycosyltransferase family 2 protein [Kitasatospora sp. NPDC094015]|uniref:glycosyltransferase n=1 Tax=Kitasatospora sp. NPDC094015 TaxID=3155205 RepID=UPI00331F61D2